MPQLDFRSPRLFVDAALAAGEAVALERSQSNYLGNVLRLSAGGTILVFNGRDGEWQAGHIADVECRALDTFPHGLPATDGNRPVAVHCKSGYRSMIACSLLERAGHRNVLNVEGGFDAWHAAELPEVAEHLAKA